MTAKNMVVIDFDTGVTALLESVRQIFEDPELTKSEKVQLLRQSLQEYADYTGRDGLVDIAAVAAFTKSFGASGEGPTHDRLKALYDDQRRGNPNVSRTANFADAWKQLTDAERDEIRREEVATAMTRQAEAEAAARGTATKGVNMTREETVAELAKDFGIVKIAKNIVSEGRAVGNLTEPELTKMATDYAQADRRSGETREQAFARFFSAKTEESLVVRKAHAIVKNFPGVAITQPRTVSGAAALSNDAGLDQLKGLIAAEMATAPWLSIEQATARVKAAAAATASARNAARING